MSRRQATLTGLLAISMWSTLGLLSVMASDVPPLQLNAMAFAISGGLTLVWAARNGMLSQAFRQPPHVLAIGIGALFGYHFLYFTALGGPRPVAANLINYLWPVLIVLFAGLLPGERVLRQHIAGVAFGFAGAALLLFSDAPTSATAGALELPNRQTMMSYLAGLGAALVWSSYSVISRCFQTVPTIAVTSYCLGAAVLSLLAHLVFETTVWPTQPAAWAALVLIGLGPVGLAFFAWDVGVKQGDIQILGAAAYLAPLLSTMLMVAAGMGRLNWSLAISAGLIAAGALVASIASWKQSRP